MDIITVSQLTKYIKEKLETDVYLCDIWVKGEVSNFKHHSSGHMYFTLKDKASALRCVVFRSRTNNIKFKPEDGMAVVARGSIAIYERDGQYQLYVEEMQPDGIGALYTAFQQLKKRLEAEGLFDEKNKRRLPSFPRKIGVITSPTGAAVRDIITVTTRRYPNIHIIIVPVAVQGEQAPQQIANGIRTASNIEGIDLLIVGRGGGSLEELWAFNTEIVARSIFECKVPVISAVGHETDFTIADFVADMRAPTPSAAAEIAVPDIRELEKHLYNLQNRLVSGTRNYIMFLKERLGRLNDSRSFKRPKENLYSKMQDIDYLTKTLRHAVLAQLNNKKSLLALRMSSLNTLSPLATIERGYAVCRNSRGEVVKKVESVNPGDKVEVIIADGTLECEVENIKEGINNV